MKIKGFTLIELMIVLVIIGILIGLISAATFKAMESAKKSRAEADIATLETALCAYEADMGDYPPTIGGDPWNQNSFYDFLEDSTGKPSSWNGPYIHFKDKDLDGNNFLDPWGQSYHYGKGGGNNGPNYFDLWSDGPDKENDYGWDDDLTNF